MEASDTSVTSGDWNSACKCLYIIWNVFWGNISVECKLKRWEAYYNFHAYKKGISGFRFVTISADLFLCTRKLMQTEKNDFFCFIQQIHHQYIESGIEICFVGKQALPLLLLTSCCVWLLIVYLTTLSVHLTKCRLMIWIWMNNAMKWIWQETVFELVACYRGVFVDELVGSTENLR